MPPNGGKEPGAKLAEEINTCDVMWRDVTWRSERPYVVYQGEKPFHWTEGPPSPPGTFAKLESLRKNENGEKSKRQTNLGDSVYYL